MTDPSSPRGAPALSASTVDGAPVTSAAAHSSALGLRAALIVYERNGARVLEIRPGQELLVGRQWPADVLIRDPSVSRRHAHLVWRDQELFVEDLKSRNGTTVSGQAAVSLRLQNGDVVRFGGITASVHLVLEGVAALRGIDTHEELLSQLEVEFTRSRYFGRGLALLAVRAERGVPNAHVSGWCPRIRAQLSDVDRLSTFGTEAAVILLPEADAERARDVAARVVASHPGGPRLYCGVATYPTSAGSPGEIVDVAQEACHRASDAENPCFASERDLGHRDAERVVIASPSMQRVYDVVRRVAPLPVPVLVLGETGTGKELVARALHECGAHPQGPLKMVNCAAIPAGLTESVLFGHERGAFTGAATASKGFFEQADGGTLLLDEVGELSPQTQVALLSVLETKRVRRVGGQREIPVDVRVVAATHRNLEAMVATGDFRADLLFRLNAVPLYLPPLRERREEIEPLCRLFIREASKSWGGSILGIEPGTLAVLEGYSWPGNIRELRNTMERAVAISSGRNVTIDDLPERMRAALPPDPEPHDSPSELPPPGKDARDARDAVEGPDGRDGDAGGGSFRERLRSFETELIVSALEQAQGNQSQAARLLGMPLRTLVHKIAAYGIKKR